MYIYKFLFSDNNKGLRYTGFILFLVLCSLLIVNTAAAGKSKGGLFYDLPDLFKNKWNGSEDGVIVYIFSFREIDREVVEENSLQAYFSDRSDPLIDWQFSDRDGLIEIRNLYDKNNSITINNFESALTGSGNYTSWLTAYKNNISKIVLKEKYVGLDRVKRAVDRSLEISLVPENISYEKQEILTGVNFHYGSKNEENRMNTKVWVDNDHFETLAFVSKKIHSTGGDRRQYFAVQLAAAVVPAKQLGSTDGSLLAVGDLSGLSKIFDNDNVDIYNTIEKRVRNTVSIGIGNDGEKIIYNQLQGRNRYFLELKKSREYQGLNYLFDIGLPLIESEDLFLSFRISNENNILTYKNKQRIYELNDDIHNPLIRIGLSDRVNWGDRLMVGLAYYPFSIQIQSGEKFYTDGLWRTNAVYQNNPWVFQYQGEYVEQRINREISLKYLLEEERAISLVCGLDYGHQFFLNLTYSFPIFQK